MTSHPTQWWKLERLTTRSVGEDVEKLELSRLLTRAQIGTTTSEHGHCLSELNTHIIYNPAVSLLDIQPKEMYTYVHQKICIRTFIEVLFISLVPLINVNSAPEFIHPSAYLWQDVRETGTCLSPKGWVMRVFLGTLRYREVPPLTSLENSDCLSRISTWGSSTKYPLNIRLFFKWKEIVLWTPVTQLGLNIILAHDPMPTLFHAWPAGPLIHSCIHSFIFVHPMPNLEQYK